MRTSALFLAMAVLPIRESASQQNRLTAAQPVHSVTGIVIDSIRGRPLASAEVVIEGTTIHATTDSLGRFTLDSLPTGTHVVGFFHPFLDSLSIATGPGRLVVPLDSGRAIVLATPSAATLVRALCPGGAAQAVLLGRVLDPETDEPVAQARVFLSWNTFEVSAQRGVRRSPQTLGATTDASGAYRICGIPPELDAMLVASVGELATPQVPVSNNGSGVLVRGLTLSTRSNASRAGAIVSGIVRDTEGKPIESANISVPGSPLTASTGRDGAFSFTGLPPGTRTLVVRRLGFVSRTASVDLTSRAVRRLEIILDRYVAVMDPVIVKARRDRGLAEVGFAQRKLTGLGSYKTAADFQRSNPRFLSDIVGTMRGVRLDMVNGRRVMRGSRDSAGCLRLVIDGMPRQSFQPGDTDELVFPEDIAAVEVYSGATAPPQFESPEQRGCTMVIVWTRVRIGDMAR